MHFNQTKSSRIPHNTIEGSEYWQKHIQQYLQCDDMTRADYCKQHQLNYHRFQYWFHKFNKEQKNTVTQKGVRSSKLIPLTLENKDALASLKPLATIEFGNNVRILLHDVDALFHLIQRLR